MRRLRRPTPSVPQPRRPEVETDTGGKQAREQAEAALGEARKLRPVVKTIRSFLDYQAAENHFTQDINILFRGQ